MSDKSKTNTPYVETAYPDWASQNKFDDDVESLGRYVEHIRGGYLEAGQYTEAIEDQLSFNLSNALVQRGLLTTENEPEINESLRSFSKLDLMSSVNTLLEEEDPENPFLGGEGVFEKLTAYKARAELNYGGQLAEEPEDYLEVAEMVRSANYEKHHELFKSSKILAAVVEDEDGNEIFLGGAIPEGETESSVIKSAAKYGVSPRHVFNLRAKRKPAPVSDGLMVYQVQERQRAEVELREVIRKDERYESVLYGLAKDYAEEKTWGFGDKFNSGATELWGGMTRTFRLGWNTIPFFEDEEGEEQVWEEIKLDERRQAVRDDVDGARQALLQQLVKETGYSGGVVDDVLNDLTIKYAVHGDTKANVSPLIEYTDDKEQLDHNVHVSKYSGAMVDPSLLTSPTEFRKALVQEGVTRAQRQQAESQRKLYLEDQFFNISAVIYAEDKFTDDWMEARMDGEQKGLSHVAILEKFRSEVDFSSLMHRAKGVGSSAYEGFTSIIFGVAAAADADWGRAGLQMIAENNAQSREVAKVFGLEMGAGQDMMEAVAPMVADAIVTAGLVAATGPTAGTSLAGLAAYTGAKTTATVSARLVITAAARGALKTVGKETVEAAAERVLKSGALKGATRERTLTVIKAYNGNIAKKMGVATASFIPAATRSGANTYGAVFQSLNSTLTAKHRAEDGSWEEGWDADRVKEEAHNAAFGSALTAGVITGLLTSGLSAIGRGGLEETFLRGMSFRQIKKVTSNILGRNLGDQTFITVMKEALKKVMRKHAIEGPKSLLRSGVDEGFEEGLDEFLNTLITDAYTNQNTPMWDRMKQVGHGILLGAGLGAGGNFVSKAAKNIAPNRFLDRNAAARVEQEVFKEFEREVKARGLGDTLRETGSPATAMEAERLTRQYKGAERIAASSVLSSDALEEDKVIGEADVVIENQTKELSEEELDEINYDLQTNLTSEAVQAELANFEAEELLGEGSPDVVGTSAAASLASSEGNAVNGSVAITSAHPAKEPPVDFDAEFERAVAEIESKRRLFKRMEKQQQLLENSGAPSAKRMLREIKSALRDNRILDKRKADGLLKLAAQTRDAKKKAQAVSDAKGPNEADAEGIDILVNSGFPHSLTVEHLERLGVKLTDLSKAALKTLSNVLASRIKKKFPIASDPFTKRGQALPQIYGSGKVYLDESGVGIFNNDPLAMLTFLESGIPIPVPSTAIESGTLNPAFEISTGGNPRYVTDIMVQESGGRVSAKTAFDKVGALEEDYSIIAALAERLTELKKSVTLSDQLKVVNPFNTRSRQIKITTVEERARDLGTFANVTNNIFDTDPSLKGLQTQFKNTATLAASLEMQVALYEYAQKAEAGVEVEPVPFNASAILRGQASYAKRQQVARKKRSTRSFVSVLSPADIAPEEVVAPDNYVAASANPLPPLPERQVRDYIAGMYDIGAESLRDNPQLKSSVANLLNSEYHGESNRAFDMPPEELFNELIQFYAKGNHISNPAGIALQKKMSEEVFDQQGTNVGTVLRVLSLDSPNVFPAIDEDVAFQSRIRKDLIELGAAALQGGKEPSLEQALAFHKDVAKTTEGNYKRAIVSSKQRAVVVGLNQRELLFYGIEDNSAEGVIGALEKLASQKTKRTHKHFLRTLFDAADALLQQREFIKTIKFSFEATTADYAGRTYIDQDGTPNVVINTARDSDGGVMDTLIHELVHAFTDRVLNLDPALRTPEQNNAVSSIESLMKLLRKRAAREGAPDSVLYGLTNINEFASVLMTSSDFQSFIRGIKVGAGQRNFLTRALAAISRFFAVRGGAQVKEFQAVMDVATLVGRAGKSEPSTGTGHASQVASRVIARQLKRTRLASSIGMAEEVTANEALDKAAFEYFQFAVDFVPSEINIVMDNTTDVIAEWDSETESIVFNGRRAAAKVNQLVAAVDGKPIRREHIIAAILNEEIAHVAAFARLSKAEVQALMDGLSDLDAQSIVEQYYPEGERAAALERFRSGDSSISEGERFVLAEEQLRIHVQKVLRGAETNEQVNFLLENPTTLGTVKQYFKNFLTKLTYTKTLKGVSPQMRDSVNRVVSEVRAMEMGYRLSPNGMHFDANNPEGTLNQLLKQVEMNKSITPREDDEGRSQTLQSQLGSDADLTEIPIALNKKGKPITQSYALLKSPTILEPSGNGRTDIDPLDFDSLHYEVTAPARKRISAAIKSGSVGEATDRLVGEVNEMLKDPSVKAGIGWYSRMRVVLKNALGDRFKLFSHLLGATSAQTPVETNFIYSMEMLTKLDNGDYEPNIKGYLELRSIAPENLRAEIESRGFASASKLKKANTPAKLARLWIDHYKILPTRDNGKLYGANSLAALKAITDTWLLGKLTPKTPQFAMNLNGESLEATIDVWAARTLRRILWGDRVENWRIQPKAETGVSNEDFALGQIIFREAAKTLDMSPDDLQALVWFGEKDVWDKNGWTKEVGAFKSSFDEAAAVFFPPNETPRSLEHGKNVIKFLQKERLAVSKLGVFEENSPKLKKALKEYEEAKGLNGVGSYVESRGREPVAELRATSPQGGVPNERDGQTNRSGSAGDVRGAGRTVTPRLQSRYGAGSVIPSDLDAESIDFSNWIEMLDIPLMEFGTYKSPSSLFGKLFVGYADRNLMRFKEERDSYVREAKKLGEDFKEKHDRIIKEASKDGVEIPPELISRASGSNVGSQLTESQIDSVEARHAKERAKANRAPDAEQRKVLLALAEKNKIANARNLRIENRNVLLADRDQAIKDLLSISPEAHDLILGLRKLVDDLSAKGNELFSDFIQGKDEFSATFDMNGGLYITRRYRMFEDNDYLARVRDQSDPTYATERQDAINYFAQQYMDYHVRKEMDDKGLSKQDARFNVELDLEQKGSNARTKGKDMMTEFLNSYEKNGIKPELDVYESADGGRSIMMNSKKFKGSALKALAENLNQKKDIPAPIRRLFGEYGDESGGDNLAHTLVHTASIMANQAFFNRVVDFGTRAKEPWLVTEKEIAADLELPVDSQKYAGWQQLKSDGGTMDWNPVKGYYTKPEIIKDFQDLISISQAEAVSKEASNPATYLGSKLVTFMHRATGLSLAAKTLGSVGFYVRNMLGNAMFFGPMQGYMGGFGKAFGEGVGVVQAFGGDAENSNSQIVRAALGSRAAMDAELTVLSSMNVFGDEMEANLLRELLLGKLTIPAAESKLAKIAKAVEDKTKVGKAAYTKGVLAATRLASAMDAYYKIGLYEFELATLKEAALADTQGGEFNRLLDENNEPSVDMKRAAAVKVKKVSQSYSQAPPAIKALTRSSAGLLVAPYVRFAAEVPRVMGNTFSLLSEERAQGKNNPVMRKRYLKRLSGMLSTMGFTFAVPMLLKSLMNIGEDEDEALRSGMPYYLRDHTFYYYKADGELYSFDLTYLNPFSIVADPVARAFETLFDDDEINPVDASIELVAGLVRPYFNEQILSGAVSDVMGNTNQYGNKIRYGDDVGENVKRGFLYVWENAYEPRSLAKLRKAFKAAEGDTPSSDMFTDPLSIIFGELLPIKPHKVDLRNNLRAYLTAHTGDYREVGGKMNKLLSPNSMDDPDIFALYDDTLKTRRTYNNELRRVLKGFNNLGISWSDIHAQAKSKGVSKERLRLNYNGWMNRPSVSLFVAGKLRETSTGRIRLRKLENYSRKDNRYIKLD